MPERDVNLYIQDIKDSIRKIETYSKDLEYKDFKKDNKTQDAVIRNLEIIGEAASQIPKDFKDKNKHIPWGKMIGMRNIIVHEYFGVDVEILWATIKNRLPELKKALKN